MPTSTMTNAPEIALPPDAATTDDHCNPRRRRRDPEPETPDVGMLIQPEPRHDLDKLILPERRLVVPDNAEWRPHPFYLGWQREHRFKR